MASYSGAGDYLLPQPAATFLDDRSRPVTGFNHLHSLSNANFAGKSNISRISTPVKSNAGVSDHPLCKSALNFVDSVPAEGKSGWISGFNKSHSLEMPKLAVKLTFSRISTPAKLNASFFDRSLSKLASNFVDSVLAEGKSSRICGFSHMHSLSDTNFAVNSSLSRISTPAESNAIVSDHPISKSEPPKGIVNDDECDYENPRVSDKLDEWMRNSVTEIVKNINQAPLLVQIYPDGEVKTEKSSSPADWPDLMTDKSPPPDGIILVEELPENVNPADSAAEFDGTKAFGVLIQGKFNGNLCKSSCYLLKTSSVNGGLGLICTHFCLMKIKSFHRSAFSQMNDCWLLQ